MSAMTFKDCTVRIGLDVLLTYSNLPAAVARALRTATVKHDDHTVIHVHVNEPSALANVIQQFNAEVIQLPGVIGLHASSGGGSRVMTVTLTISFIETPNHDRLRRIDVFFIPHPR